MTGLGYPVMAKQERKASVKENVKPRRDAVAPIAGIRVDSQLCGSRKLGPRKRGRLLSVRKGSVVF